MKENKSKIFLLLEENKSQINIAIKEDGRVFDFDDKKLKKIITRIESKNNKKSKKIKQDKNGKIVYTNGNPYTTIYVLLKAALEGNKVILCTNGVLENLNKQLVRIFNQLSSKKLFNYKSDIKVKELYLTIEKKNDIDIEVYDNINVFIELLEFGFNAKYISLYTIDIYYDSDEYDDMVEVVEDYANSKYMELNVYKNKNYVETLLRTGSDLSGLSLLILTKNPNKYEVLKEKFPNKNIYINYNPFDDFEENVIKKICKL